MATAINPQILQVFKDLEALWLSRDFSKMRG